MERFCATFFWLHCVVTSRRNIIQDHCVSLQAFGSLLTQLRLLSCKKLPDETRTYVEVILENKLELAFHTIKSIQK